MGEWRPFAHAATSPASALVAAVRGVESSRVRGRSNTGASPGAEADVDRSSADRFGWARLANMIV